MAETPEEVALRLCRVAVKPHVPDEWGVTCSCVSIASALRAQYVAGLEAALEVVDRWSGPTAYHIERDIRELAEQAKRG